MKNIHLLPTDKPSRLYLTTHEYIFEEGYSLPTDECENKNIYITSNEEIKEGDWFTDDNNSLKRSYKLSHVQFANPKKIILTTDQDLIKNGVQAIDDEFLEWFVKNPSCEFVEVKCYSKFNDGDFSDYKIFEEKLKHINKIIIPKEEPKQETLEEAAELALVFHNTYEKLAPSFGYETRQDTKEFDFKSNNGRLMVAVCSEVIKWQQEQDKKMYSEEDLEVAYFEGREGLYSFNDWFEQFKNK
jgi:hypothetical protein